MVTNSWLRLTFLFFQIRAHFYVHSHGYKKVKATNSITGYSKNLSLEHAELKLDMKLDLKYGIVKFVLTDKKVVHWNFYRS